MPYVAEVASPGSEVMTRNAATESGTANMAGAKPADVSAAETAAYMGATAETAAVSTTEAPTVSTATTSAARKRISGQSSGESGSRRQGDHGLAQH